MTRRDLVFAAVLALFLACWLVAALLAEPAQ